MRITDLCGGRGRSAVIQPPARSDPPTTGIAAENTILVPLIAGLGNGFGLRAPERAGQTQVNVRLIYCSYFESAALSRNFLLTR